ncbi:hypothetical protein [Rugamonas sp. DEMB1]|uniref:hypothetical protein n=1 Tax=Rugamonas sp. DEMB1 TaxID=3039386 RepID=UPI00391892CA
MWNAADLPVSSPFLRCVIVYLCDSAPADIDNIIKPIQDALVGLVFEDDFLVSDVDSHRRFLADPIDVTSLPPLLQAGVAKGEECVYVRICDAQQPEELLMTISTQTLRDRKMDALAATYAKEGYLVLKEPAAGELPFDLNGYRPDLIAKKDDGGLIIEVRAGALPGSVDRVQYLAQEISKHPGWRFLLATVADADPSIVPTTADDLPTWRQLADKLTQARALAGNGAVEPALLYLWGIFEAALRKRAIAENIPVERLPPAMLLNHMYSQGEVSIAQHDLFREFMTIRNRMAHGANTTVDSVHVATLLNETEELVADWAAAKAV